MYEDKACQGDNFASIIVPEYGNVLKVLLFLLNVDFAVNKVTKPIGPEQFEMPMFDY